jgi:hypothetical protein
MKRLAARPRGDGLMPPAFAAVQCFAVFARTTAWAAGPQRGNLQGQRQRGDGAVKANCRYFNSIAEQSVGV